MYKFFFLLFISTPAFADDWSKADAQREAAYLVLHTMDWAQTRQIAKNPQCVAGQKEPCLSEENGILGDHPSVAEVNRYFILTGAAQYLIAKAVPEKYRAPFQYLTIGHDFGYVVHNYSIGIRIKF